MRVDILVVHSDPGIAQELRSLLERQGHRVRISAGVSQALLLLEGQRVDLLVAECQQLEVNGASLFRHLSHLPQPPMILPATPAATPDGQAIMAGDLARVAAVVAQVQHLLSEDDGETLRVGDLVIDMASKHVTLHGHRVTLPPIQFRLLAYLAQHAGRVVGARELLRAVWGYEGDEAEARELVKVHVRQIRRKLGLEAQRPDYVQSVRGFGYVVTAPAGQAEAVDPGSR